MNKMMLIGGLFGFNCLMIAIPKRIIAKKTVIQAHTAKTYLKKKVHTKKKKRARKAFLTEKREEKELQKSEKVPVIDKQKVLMVSIPKAGSHLLLKALEGLTGKTGTWMGFEALQSFDSTAQFAAMHLAHQPKDMAFLADNQFKGVFIYRDPRELIVSTAHWIQEQYPRYFNDYQPIINDFSAIIKRLIGEVVVNYERYMPIKKNPLFCSVTFEELVGPMGGGSEIAQLNALKKIAAFLKLSLNKRVLKEIARNLFGGTATFRKGQIDSWKEVFTAEHKRLFKAGKAGQLLRELGYEKDNNW